MTRPEASNEFGQHDWSGDRGSIGHCPNMCLACEALFWGHKSRMICRKCDDDLRACNMHPGDISPPVYAGAKLRRLLVWMLPAGIAAWGIIYAIVRAWFLR